MVSDDRGCKLRFPAAALPQYALLLFFVFGTMGSKGQEYSYSRYDVPDGLAGSNVYAIAQDKRGFLWFGTENGLSRFDGQIFTNYTTANGLPDNEIINLFSDSKGRLWIAPFRNTICYFYQGRLHTQQNDSILARLNFRGAVMGMEEDAEGNMAFMELFYVHFLFADSTVLEDFNSSSFSDLGRDESGRFIFFRSSNCLRLVNRKLEPFMVYPGFFRIHDLAMNQRYLVAWRGDSTQCVYYRDAEARKAWNNPMHVSFSILSDSEYVDNGRDGAYLCSNDSERPLRTYLPGKVVTQTFRDDEGNLWFCTQREGVYKLNSSLVRNLRLVDARGRVNSAQSLVKIGTKLYAGTELGNIFEISAPSADGSLHAKVAFHARSESAVVSMAWDSLYGLAFGEDSTVRLLSSAKASDVNGGIKDMHFVSSHRLLVSNSNGVVELDMDNGMRRIGYPRLVRSTCIFARGDTMYVGSLQGLYVFIWHSGDPPMNQGEPLVAGRISGILPTPRNTIWVSTYGNGLLELQNNQVVRQITEKDGLSSNICRKIFLRDSILWVATDKGLNKINVLDRGNKIEHYYSSDGLLSDLITSVYADGEMIYAGTPEGISYFKYSQTMQSASCRLVMRRITISGNPIELPQNDFQLERRQNNIRFDYSGISYRSGGNMTYWYKLTGLDSTWKTTTEEYLSYPSLEPGDYHLHIKALNKFGIFSEEQVYHVKVLSYWWERWYVWLSAGILMILAVIWGAGNRIRRVRREEQEKTRMREKLVTLEHMALRAQMNPHFIFNSLNSIQHFVMQKDIIGANQYLSGLSKLIRLTLDYSGFEEIRVRDEMDYIRLYLELERNRTMEKFNYSIEMPEDIRSGYYYIPPMVLQPFVENSIRHGIRYRTDKNGHIFVGVERHGATLHFIIRDNGVGREASRDFNRPGHIEYQSRGIELTVQRIGLLKRDGQPAGVIINDIIDETGKVAGTEVVIRIPA